MGKKKYTDEEKDRWVEQVDKLRNEQGLTLLQACKKINVEPSLYQWWKGKREGKYSYERKPKVTNQDLAKTIALAINQMDEPTPQSRITRGPAPAAPQGRSKSFLALLNRVYAIKAAISELERDLLEGMSESSYEQEAE